MSYILSRTASVFFLLTVTIAITSAAVAQSHKKNKTAEAWHHSSGGSNHDKGKDRNGHPQPSCPAGTVLLAKFELSGGGYVFEKPDGNEGIVAITGDPNGASWTSSVPISTVVLKGALDTDTILPGGFTAGSFTNANLQTPSGRTAGISNVQFCVCDQDAGPPSVTYSVEEVTPGADFNVHIQITDDTGLHTADISTPDGNLTLLASDFVVGAKVANFVYAIVDLNLDSRVIVLVSDLCGSTLCGGADDVAPLFDTREKVKPGANLIPFALTDASGIVDVPIFNVSNVTVNVYPFSPGDQDVWIDVQILRGPFTFGIVGVDGCGNALVSDPNESIFDTEAFLTAAEFARPNGVELNGAYPNPFNPTTSIDFTLPREMKVRLAVYDSIGREVAVLADGHLAAGNHSTRFEAGTLASGIYFYRLVVPGAIHQAVLNLVK